MTQPLTDFSTTARRLSAWLGVWRILIIVFGVLGVLGLGFGFVLLRNTGEDFEALGSLLSLLPLLFIILIGVMTWIYSMLLGKGKEWVDGATSAVEHNNQTQLGAMQSVLDKWLGYFIWGMLAYLIIVALIAIGFVATAGAVFGDSWGAMFGTIGVIVLLVFMIGSFLIGTYFPYTALRQFLASATARLQGSATLVTPSANKLQSWMWVLIILQLLSLLSNLFSSFLGLGTDDGGMGAMTAIITLPLTLGISALYLIPMWLVGKFATLLGGLLDRRKPDSVPPPSATTPLPDNLSIGRIADDWDNMPQR